MEIARLAPSVARPMRAEAWAPPLVAKPLAPCPYPRPPYLSFCAQISPSRSSPETARATGAATNASAVPAAAVATRLQANGAVDRGSWRLLRQSDAFFPTRQEGGAEDLFLCFLWQPSRFSWNSSRISSSGGGGSGGPRMAQYPRGCARVSVGRGMHGGAFLARATRGITSSSGSSSKSRSSSSNAIAGEKSGDNGSKSGRAVKEVDPSEAAQRQQQELSLVASETALEALEPGRLSWGAENKAGSTGGAAGEAAGKVAAAAAMAAAAAAGLPVEAAEVDEAGELEKERRSILQRARRSQLELVREMVRERRRRRGRKVADETGPDFLRLDQLLLPGALGDRDRPPLLRATGGSESGGSSSNNSSSSSSIGSGRNPGDAAQQVIPYFGFGSNMSVEKLQARVPGRLTLLGYEAAKVRNHRLAFNMRGFPPFEPTFGGIEPAPGQEIHGVLAFLSRDDYDKLYISEGGGVQGWAWAWRPYVEYQVEVTTYSGETVQAIAFRTNPKSPSFLAPEQERPPSRRYLDLILLGANELGLDPSYIAALEETKVAQFPYLWL